MKAVKLFAYFANNLGDDLMVDILLKRYPKCRFWFDGRDPASDCFLRYPNFRNRNDIFRKYGRLNHIINILTLYKKEDFLLHWIINKQTSSCKGSVMIGGSMFIQEPQGEACDRVVLEEKRLNVFPRFVVGVNFGPYHTEDFLQAFEGYFQNCQSVTFRDQTSYRLFAGLPGAAYAPDVVLNLPTEQYIEEKSDGTVVISVIDVSARASIAQYADRYESCIVNACEECVRRSKKPLLISFCEREGDVDAITRIQKRLPPLVREQTETYFYKNNLEEALGYFAKADFVLATRFHAMILAICFQKPFYCISYNDKIKWVMEDLGCDAYCQMEHVDELCLDAVMDRYTRPVDAEHYKRQAAQQFAQLDRFLKGERM